MSDLNDPRNAYPAMNCIDFAGMPPPSGAQGLPQDIPGAIAPPSAFGIFGSAPPQFSTLSLAEGFNMSLTSRSCSPKYHYLHYDVYNPDAAMCHLDLATSCDVMIESLFEAHPVYLEAFQNFHHNLMSGPGPLPEYMKHYIAIMAACRHQCSYLVEDQKQAFLEAGGDQTWLQGYNHVPNKLQQLHTINIILAHRPWLLEKQHVESLLKTGWSMGQLTQAICILAHYHALSSFVYGSGLEHTCADTSTIPSPHLTSIQQQNCASSSPNSQELSEGGVDILVERMKTISMTDTTDGIVEFPTKDSFDDFNDQTASISDNPSMSSAVGFYEDMSPDLNFTYIDFTRRGEKSQAMTLKSQEFSWEDRGYAVINELYRDVSELLDDKFKTAYNMTYYTCGDKTQIDTYLFRRAVWNYLQCLYGIRHDDYDYGQVNKLIARNLKMFLKTVSCHPEKLINADTSGTIMKGFQNSEKIHVLILALESRLQTELVYGLRALSRYLM